MNTLASTGHSLLVSAFSTMSIDAAGLSERSEGAVDALVVRLRTGELDAVGEAYDRYHESVRRFARRLVGDDGSAEDLVQEVFVRLPKLIAAYRGEAPLGSYLIAVAVNLARHHVRAASRRRAAADRARIEEEHLSSDGGPRPDRELERRELAVILTRALDQLSLEHRAAFVLSEVEGRNSREVARILDVPEGTVRSRLSYSKRRLRAVIEAEGF